MIPRAVIFYTGEAIEDDDFDEAIDEDLDMDDDDDDLLDDSDEDETDNLKAKRKGTTNGRGANSKQKKEVPPECKQQ